jgi:hypothetical protein
MKFIVSFIVATFVLLRAALTDAAALIERQATSTASATPDYFDTASDGPFPGPTQTGQAPFLAETNPVPGSGLPTGTQSFVPNTPLQTSEPILNNTNNINIFQYMGNLSPYFPNPIGFGVEEYSLPSNCNITTVFVLHRHGSRYPTTGNTVQSFGTRIKNSTTFNATGGLSYFAYGIMVDA